MDGQQRCIEGRYKLEFVFTAKSNIEYTLNLLRHPYNLGKQYKFTLILHLGEEPL